MQSIKTLFLNRNFLPARDLTRDQTELHPFTLSIPSALKVVVIGDQLTSLEAHPFTILIAPNPMGQPGRLEKLSLAMPNPAPRRHHALGDPFEQGTPAPSDADGFVVPDVG